VATDPGISIDGATRGAHGGASQGWMADGVHVYPVRVYYEDTDVGGVVYYANYLKFAERARTEMLRVMGFPHGEMMQKENRAFTVRRCEADYIKPARFDDALEVHSNNIDMEAAGFWLDQRVKRDGEVLAVLRVRLACIGQNGRPARLPERLRGVLKALAAPAGGLAQSKASQEAGKEIGGIMNEPSIKERV
jgi:acyl-CoA thioester hydrolase